ncbi:MAG TPA: trigger factor [Patescibacteria group bacterium]|nr:trigger factor [Patescibacteria group bacterium]
MANSQVSRKDSEITLTITIPAKRVDESFTLVKAEALKEVKVPGFRTGKAPGKLAESQLNEDRLAQSLFQEVVPLAYAQAVSEHQLKPIIPPQVSVTSFKKGEDLIFEAKTAELPQVVLKDYKKSLKSVKGKIIYDPKGKPVGDSEKITASQVLDKIRETAKISIPHILIDYEVQRMLSSLIDQVNSLGLTMDQYLSSQGKKPEDLQKEYHEIAERNLKDEFILNQISREEKITASEKEIADAIEAAPDDKTRERLQEQRGKAYLEDVLRKRKTIEYLIKTAEG